MFHSKKKGANFTSVVYCYNGPTSFPLDFLLPETVCIVFQLMKSIKLECPFVVSELARSTNKTKRYL